MGYPIKKAPCRSTGRIIHSKTRGFQRASVSCVGRSSFLDTFDPVSDDRRSLVNLELGQEILAVQTSVANSIAQLPQLPNQWFAAPPLTPLICSRHRHHPRSCAPTGK